MGLTAYDFLEEMIMERTNQTLHGGLKGTKIFYKEREAIMKSLDQEIKDKFEESASDMLYTSAEECVVVYKSAFLDGLRLGHKVFR